MLHSTVIQLELGILQSVRFHYFDSLLGIIILHTVMVPSVMQLLVSEMLPNESIVSREQQLGIIILVSDISQGVASQQVLEISQ